MNNSVYDAPNSKLLTEGLATDAEFYIVSTTKFTVLFLLTFGLYIIYWFYRNWKLYKAKNELDIWPVPRAIFNIFFAHSLFNNIDIKLKNLNTNYSWNAGTVATGYVFLSILSNICDRLSAKEIGSPYTDILSILVLPLLLLVLLKAQNAINISSADPEGKSNANFTAANYTWIFLGACIWMLVAAGVLIMLGFIPE